MIGLLQCDHVRHEFRPIAGDYDEMFRRWLPAEWRVYDVVKGEIPGKSDECEGYLTTGSRASVYDDEPWIGCFANFVRKLYADSVPLVGICFGHQMIAHALGGIVRKSTRGWGIGVHQFEVIQQKPWMRPALKSFGILMSCQDQVEVLPQNSLVLAKSEHCPVGMFQAGSLLGIQGHPEFTPDYARALLRFRTQIIGAAPVSAALDTLGDALDSCVLSSWTAAFLVSGRAFPGRTVPGELGIALGSDNDKL